MSKDKRKWYKQFDDEILEDSIKHITDVLSVMKSKKGHNHNDSFIKDLEYQREVYIKRLANKTK